AAVPPALADEVFAARVRHVAKRRRVMRSGATATVLAVMGIVATVVVWPRSPRQHTEVAQSAADPVRLRAELVALRSDADARFAVVERVLDREEMRTRSEKLQQAMNRPDALERVHR